MSFLLAFAIWRWLYKCADCGERRCPSMRYADPEQDHAGVCWK